MNKQCTGCHGFKDLSEFSKHGGSKDGLRLDCKSCVCLYLKEYRRTRLGLLGVIYANQKQNSKARKHEIPDYTLKDFRVWALNSKVFHHLYDNWVLSDYDKKLTPSADRLNDYKSYTFDNLQWMTWQENNDKGHTDRKQGLNNKNSKAVKQYSLGGVFIKEFHSGREAERLTGVSGGNISLCCLDKLKIAGGFIWYFSEGDDGHH